MLFSISFFVVVAAVVVVVGMGNRNGFVGTKLRCDQLTFAIDVFVKGQNRYGVGYSRY